MMFGGSFCQVLLGVLAKFRSPPIPLIAGDGDALLKELENAKHRVRGSVPVERD